MKANKKNGSKIRLKRERNLQRAAVEIVNDVDGLSHKKTAWTEKGSPQVATLESSIPH